MKKRSIKSLDYDNDGQCKIDCPSHKKQKTNNNHDDNIIAMNNNKKNKTMIDDLFDNEDDKNQFSTIYNTLRVIPTTKQFAINILFDIAIYATGDIKICNACNQTPILYLKSKQYKKQYFRNYIDDLRGLGSCNSIYIYCMDCFINPYNDKNQFIECDSCDGKYPKQHLNAEGGDYQISGAMICDDCINGDYVTQCNDCNSCFLNYKNNRITDKILCQLCDKNSSSKWSCCNMPGSDEYDYDQQIICQHCELIVCRDCRSFCEWCQRHFCYDCGHSQDKCYWFINHLDNKYKSTQHIVEMQEEESGEEEVEEELTISSEQRCQFFSKLFMLIMS